ncbi:M48 family metalloprotease [Phenylobacterium sp. LjRoot225]|uniref:M48 family metalloprotease n=1 Tax=Phenylobacterium sp. LjRoot225 TaxID=3342285 RepID=UPI003ECF0962
MSRRHLRPVVAALAALSLATSAAAAPSQTPEQRRAEILQAFGGAYEGPINAYVSRIGARMAAAAGQGGRCTFSVINSEVVNAFASPPGCDIYVTRGLLGLIRSEDELAAVLGHEVGHVAANHAGRRQTRSAITGIGALILGAVTGSGEVAQIAGKAGQLGVLSYSRGQEFEADSLSARYLASAGYNPFGLADMLSALQASDQIETLDQGTQTKAQPVWSRTHPLTGERVARAVSAARATAPSAPGAAPARLDGYLDAVDGLLFGEDPEQGVVIGRRFLHPGLGFGFTGPQGFVLANSPSAVMIQGSGGLRAQFAGAVSGRGDPVDEAYAALRQVIGQAPARTAELKRTRIGGYDAVVLPAQAQASNGWVDVTVVVYAVGRETFHLVTLAPAGQAYVFDPLIGSFHRLTAAERAEARPKRIRVVAVTAGDTVASLAARMAVEDHPREQFEAINGLQPGDALRPGDRVKIVAAGS